MSTAGDILQGLALAESIAMRIAAAFGLDREAVIRVAKAEVHRLAAEPPDQAAGYRAARAEVLGDADERSELERARHDTDPDPTPRPSGR